MTTVCMIGHPAPGHVNPTLPVVAELARRGEHVFYYATEPFKDKIEKTGASYRSLGHHSLFERNLACGGILGGMAGLMESTEQLLPDLITQLQHDAPDYLLVEAHALWGNLLAQITGLPTITLCSMFAMNRNLIPVAQLARHLYQTTPAMLEGLVELNHYLDTARRLDHRYGTRSPGVLDFLGNPQKLNIVFTAREFQVGAEAFDSSYKFVGPTSGIRMEGGDGASNFDCSVLHEPLIYIAMGTMYNREIDLYKACLKAFAESPYQIVMAVGHRVAISELGEIPANFVVRSYLPQLEILQRAELFITHGGINSAHEAMLYGVPMVVLPAAADHFIVAQQVEAVGAGIVLPRSLATEQSLRTCADRVLAGSACRQNSSRMGDALRAAGGASRAADEIQHFIQSRTVRQEADHVCI